jgi:penicillin-insensitive murein endopeptidase
MKLLHACRGTALALAVAVAWPAPADAEAVSANALFGAVERPTADREVAVIGSYARGCLQGAVELPLSGPGWQVMRPSRNRNWGHPGLVRFIEALAAETKRQDGMSLLVGDLGQPRGGPARFGHASHQIGLDVDVWLTPAPARLLSRDERESLTPVSMVEDGSHAVDPAHFGPFQAALIRRAARFAEVARIFVNPGIKRALCAGAVGDRAWLGKVRPWYGHAEHLHVRLRCPSDQAGCRDQDPPSKGDGCDGDLQRWLDRAPYQPKERSTPARPVALAELPTACRDVLREP